MAEARAQNTYILMERLWTGSVSEIYRALSNGLAGFQRTVAIRRLLPHIDQNEKLVRAFLDGTNLAAGFAHANIVQVIDIRHLENTYFTVMEYVDGVNLDKLTNSLRTRGQALPLGLACHIAMNVCDGLQCAHELLQSARELTGEEGKSFGVAYGDVAPTSILLSKKGEVKIVDLSLARMPRSFDKTGPHVSKYKVAYLAPEVRANAIVSAQADVFAIGVVLWELLAGRAPYIGETDHEIIMQARKVALPPIRSINPSVPEELDAILRKALAIEPERRFPSAAQMSEQLAEFLMLHRLKVASSDLAKFVTEAAQLSSPTHASPGWGALATTLPASEPRLYPPPPVAKPMSETKRELRARLIDEATIYVRNGLYTMAKDSLDRAVRIGLTNGEIAGLKPVLQALLNSPAPSMGSAPPSPAPSAGGAPPSPAPSAGGASPSPAPSAGGAPPSPAPSAGGAPPSPAPSAGGARPSPKADGWYVAIRDIPVGPLSLDELRARLVLGEVTTDTMCWREGYDDWQPLRTFNGLARLLLSPSPMGPAIPVVAREDVRWPPSWPSGHAYLGTLQRPAACFLDERLRGAVIARNRRGNLPLSWIGGSAIVFKAEVGGSSHAIRCFVNPPDATAQARYQMIDHALSGLKDRAWAASVSYLPEGIRVDGGVVPLVRMDWVEGVALHEYVRGASKGQLDTLVAAWERLLTELQAAGIAHGDLQHGNVLVASDGAIRLVDYDGMFVPGMEVFAQLEAGHGDYQHPERRARKGPASRDVDTFSALVIDVTLRLLAAQPALCARVRDDGLLFGEQDFTRGLGSSETWALFKGCPDTKVRDLAGQLEAACRNPLADIAPLDVLLELEEVSAARSDSALNPGAPMVEKMSELDAPRATLSLRELLK